MDISTGDDVITLISYNENFLTEAILLYNSSDMRYATGYADKVSEDQLALVLDQACSQENEFVSCIFITSASGMENDPSAANTSGAVGASGTAKATDAVGASGTAKATDAVGASGTAKASGTQLVGILSGVLQGNELWIKLLAILPSFRNAGIGTRSISLILGYFAKRYDVINVFVSVVEENKGGLHFWTRQGFSVTDGFYKALFGENRKYKVAIMNKRL